MLIESIATLIYKKINSTVNVPQFNYFKQYVSCIDIYDSELLDFINDEHYKIDKEFIKDAVTFTSIDVPRNITIENDDFIAYIIYLIIMSIYQHKYVKEYRLNTNTLILEGKSRPDTFTGIILFKNDTELNVICKPVNKYGYNVFFKSIVDTMVRNNVPIPYHMEINDFIFLEKCDSINISRDYLIEVFKDLINQFKNINEYYWVTFFTHKDIGRSRNIKGRYFLYNFDSLIDKKKDNKYSYKMQINRITEVLEDVYGNNKCISIVSNFVELQTDNHTIFDNCISFLMQLNI